MLKRRREPQYGLQASPKRSWRKRALWIAPVIVVVSLVAVFVFGKREATAPSIEVQTADSMSESQPVKVSGKYMFSGTVVLARAVENAAKTTNGYDYSQPFGGMDSFQPEQYDEWLVDWECPSSSKVTIPYAQQVANLQFNCRPEWLPQFSKYFSMANLANNHSGDLGQETFLETQQNLSKGGLQIVGNYDPAKTDDVCEVMGVDVHVKLSDGKTKKSVLPIAYCAWHYFFRDPAGGEIETARQFSEVMPVFGLMHAGVEYVAKAGANQGAIARRIIDNGAEFVVGNSPHWVQNSEVYKGKPIFYSTGNFIFDQLETETNRGVNIAVTMEVDYDQNVAAWLELAQQCQPKKANDDCLAMAKKQGLEKITPKLSYEPIANTSGARQVTKKASPAIQQAVEVRLNWAETKRKIGQ